MGGLGLPMGGHLAPVMKVLQKVSLRRSVCRRTHTNHNVERPIPHDRKYADGRRDGASKRRHERAHMMISKREKTRGHISQCLPRLLRTRLVGLKCSTAASGGRPRQRR